MPKHLILFYLFTFTAISCTNNKPEGIQKQKTQLNKKVNAHLLRVASTLTNNASHNDNNLPRPSLADLKEKFIHASFDEKIDLMDSAENNASIPFLLFASTDKNAEIRLETIFLLVDYTDQKSVTLRLCALLNDSDEEVVLETLEAISDINTPSVISALKKTASSHKNPIIKSIAADYLIALSD